MEIMNLISANNTLGNVSIGNVIGAATFSNQTASLRGLERILDADPLNGKRLGTFSGGITGAEGVNLAAIPFAAIDRVEVLKDGASAIYGSDAIAGVINFITRQDFSGIDATAWYGAPTRTGGGEQYQLMATAGYGDLTKDTLQRLHRRQLPEQKSPGPERAQLLAVRLHPGHQPQHDVGTDVSGLHLDRQHRQPRAFPNARRRSSWARAAVIDPSAIDGVNSIPNTKQLNLFGSARYQINQNWQAYLTGMYSHSRKRGTSSSRTRSRTRSSRPRRRAAPRTSCCRRRVRSIRPRLRSPPASTASRSTCAIAASSAATATRPTPTRQWQIVARRQGHAWNWDWDASFNYSQNKSKEQS